MSENRKLLTAPLKLIVDNLLGDNHYVNIDMELANLIYLVTENKDYCFIQFDHEETGESFVRPRLWNLHYWRVSTESWQKAHARQDRDRVLRWIEEANVKLISKEMRRAAWALSDNAARMLAHNMLRQGVKLEQLQILYPRITKLITKEEELQ